MIHLRFASDGHMDQLRCPDSGPSPSQGAILLCSHPLGGRVSVKGGVMVTFKSSWEACRFIPLATNEGVMEFFAGM
jgi:hypothetical protein